MLALLKKRVRKEFAFPPIMEITQLTPSLQDPNQFPLEAPEESLHEEQPLGNSRTESLDMERILPHLTDLRDGQNSLISEITELRTLINKMNQLLKEAESRLSSLEARDDKIQQTVCRTQRQSDPRAVPAASSFFFSSHQMNLDTAQTAVSLSSSEYTSKEPASPLASRASGYPKSEEKAHQRFADLWSQESTSKRETALIEAEESIDEDYIFSRASPLITPDFKNKPQNLTSTEEAHPPMLTPGWSLERVSESETVHIGAEESFDQEDNFYRASPPPKCEKEPQTLMSTEEAYPPMLTPVWSLEGISESETVYIEAEVNQNIFSRALPSIASEHETDPQPLTSTEELALPMITAIGSQERIADYKTTHTEPEAPDQKENNFSGGSPVACEPEQQPLMSILLETPQLTAPAAMPKETPGRATHLCRSHSSSSSSSSTSLTSTMISDGTFSHPAPLPPADMRPPVKRRKTVITYWHFTEKSKFITTCNICKMDVTTEKIGGSDTAILVSHLEREHQLSQEKVALSMLPATGSKIQDVERPSTAKRPSRTTTAASIGTPTSPATLSCLFSPSPADMRPSTKHQKKSFVWKHFTKKTKIIATCNICNVTVKTGKIGGCSNVGTATLISHLKRIHSITQ